MKKKERRMRACRRLVRVKGCQIARTRTMKPLITINCIVWTAALYVYNILHMHTDTHNRIIYTPRILTYVYTSYLYNIMHTYYIM